MTHIETLDPGHNPMQTDGFEFVEYATDDPKAMDQLFRQMGFTAIARHKSKQVVLYRQGDINFILNSEPDSFAEAYARMHGPSANAMAFRVRDAAAAITRARQLGAEIVEAKNSPAELTIPAIKGIGGSLLYLVDRYGEGSSIYDHDFDYLPGVDRHPAGAGLTYLDHLTHNVHRGHMDEWAGFYQRLFNFKQIRYFDIEGKLTGLKSRAMTSPCGKIRIPINESVDDKSQIEEFLQEYRGEGIQHIALGTSDIYRSVELMQKQGIRFLDTPDTYYEKIDERLPGHGEPLDRLKKLGILVDGAPESAPGKRDGGLLLQIFTQTVIGPIFFELIQRKGDEGFGEGNFRALFESIEEDQIRRGVL
jgi:4-hydroxyphenylpyruvate dioxygenase